MFAPPLRNNAHLNDAPTVIDDAGGNERDGPSPFIDDPQSPHGDEYCEQRAGKRV
jgi:hypothetical protein